MTILSPTTTEQPEAPSRAERLMALAVTGVVLALATTAVAAQTVTQLLVAAQH